MADDDPATPFPDYGQLRERVAAVLPADAAGRHRPPVRDPVRTYWEIGRLLNEHLRGRAAYGQRAVARLAEDLGVLPRTLYRARKLHQRLPAEAPALPGLTWSHCRLLVTVADDGELQRLMRQVAGEGWSVRRLQEHLRGRPAEAEERPARGRPGTYRIVAASGDPPTLLFDLGFGVRRPLAALGRTGKRTRRLIAQLTAGDVVEVVRDAKGRPAVRRLWGQVEPRLYTYTATLLDAPATGVLRVLLELGLDVYLERRLRLCGAAGKLSATRLRAGVAAAPTPVVIRTRQPGAGSDVEADVFALPGEADPRVIADRGRHLNAAWPGDG